MHLLYAIIENGVYRNTKIMIINTSEFVSGRGSFGRAAGNWTADMGRRGWGSKCMQWVVHITSRQ